MRGSPNQHFLGGHQPRCIAIPSSNWYRRILHRSQLD
uniref:Uncharacterized protein n=1 Tax=Cryptococcus bacillisporus CA1280 TaxID=1296109 RepID=A0A0D0VNE3_CRYGA|nr:hypothetical protein I312_04022 [Cryptococcus bacillisporus CA1280]